MPSGNKMLQNLGLLLALYTMLWWGCAQIGPLSGGPKDTQAPQIDSLESTPNYQTNFTEKTFRITFDEWLALKDVFNQVVVSPPLIGGKPEVSLEKKTVVVNLGEEDLREDATYIVNFGESVTDFTEGNAVPDLRFVFSTGDFIDSLELNGSIVDAFTGQPVDKCLFMLYDNLSDTVVRKDIPFYFSKTDELGNFKLQNLKADTFKTFALLSSDPNYRYDQSSEQIGFVDSFIVLNDSARFNLKIRIFQELPELRSKKLEKGGYGLQKLVYNQKPYDAQIDFDSLEVERVQIIEEDTIKIWYHWLNDESWKIYLQQDTLFDTLRIDTTGRKAFLANARLRPQREFTEGQNRINPLKDLQFQFNFPLKNIDSSLVYLWEDSIKTRVFPKLKIDSLDQRKLSLSYAWKEEMTYQLQLLPGAIKDLYGHTTDSLQQNYQVQHLDDFGTFTIKLTEMDSTLQFVFQLLKGEQVLEEQVVLGQSNYQFEYPGLSLGADYVVRLIEDVLPNGRWDTGSYDKMRQPERLRNFPLQELRANFEAEETIIGKF